MSQLETDADMTREPSQGATEETSLITHSQEKAGQKEGVAPQQNGGYSSTETSQKVEEGIAPPQNGGYSSKETSQKVEGGVVPRQNGGYSSTETSQKVEKDAPLLPQYSLFGASGTSDTPNAGVSPESGKVASGSPPVQPSPWENNFYTRLRKTKSDSNSFLEFALAFSVLLISTATLTVVMLLSSAIPIAMIVMGSIHLDDCPAEKMIPIYLIVGGAVGLAKDLANVFDRCRNKHKPQTERNCLESFVNFFLFAWLIAGCVFIYRIYDDFSTNSSRDSDYCDLSLYWFSFCVNTCVLVYLGVMLALFCACSSVVYRGRS